MKTVKPALEFVALVLEDEGPALVRRVLVLAATIGVSLATLSGGL